MRAVELHDEVEIAYPYWEPDSIFYRELTPEEQDRFKRKWKDQHDRVFWIHIGVRLVFAK